MERISVGALCVAAAFAATLVLAATASAALPELRACVKSEGGKFTDDDCLDEAVPPNKGKFENEPIAKLANKKFTGKSRGTFLYISNGMGGLAETQGCKKSTTDGTVKGPQELEMVTVTFSGCTTGGLRCNSKGQAPGVIQTLPLMGQIRYLEKAVMPPKVGVLLSPEAGGGQPVAEWTCGGLFNFKETGSVTAEIVPVNSFTKELTLAFRANATTGQQEWRKFEGEAAIERFLVVAGKESGLSMTTQLKLDEVEVAG
jgi:hypothetical protein